VPHRRQALSDIPTALASQPSMHPVRVPEREFKQVLCLHRKFGLGPRHPFGEPGRDSFNVRPDPHSGVERIVPRALGPAAAFQSFEAFASL